MKMALGTPTNSIRNKFKTEAIVLQAVQVPLSSMMMGESTWKATLSLILGRGLHPELHLHLEVGQQADQVLELELELALTLLQPQVVHYHRLLI